MIIITSECLSSKVNGIKINNSYPCNANNYSNSSSRNVEYIVIHYTGNAKDTALNNCKYFQSPNRSASAHFFCDDENIYQSVELRDSAWHCGCSKGYKTACRNNNSIGIEMCTSGNYIVSEKTQINTAYLCAELCKMVGISASTVDKYVLRHYDVVASNKKCPCQFVDDVKQWMIFKMRVKNILENNSPKGWAKYNNNWYWLDTNGNIVKNSWIQDKNKWYHLSSNGIMDTNNWIKNNSETWSYVNNLGEAVVGWHNLLWKSVKSWYYFDENGNMVSSKWVKNKGKDYYLTSSGAMATNSYIKSLSSSVYYWVGSDGVWQPQWNTNNPDLKKHKVVQ